MTATAASINHRIADEIPAARTWKRLEHAALSSSSSEGHTKDNSASSEPQPEYLSLKSGSVMEQNQTNLILHQPSISKHKRLLSGESKETCTPWRTKDYTCDPPGLHEEICDFYEYMKPRLSEISMRSEVVSRVTHIIQNKWPQARVEVFGSFSTYLFLPSSDIDLVVFGRWSHLPLFSLEEEFIKADVAVEGSILVLDKTTVPIIKFIDKQTEVKVDISFNHKTGLQSVGVIQEFILQFPLLPKLFLVLKQFLTQRQLNEVFYGGISSYALLLLLVSFLQLHPRQAANDATANLGVLLIEFFELYGRNFNYMKTAIRVRNGGSYFPKDELLQDDADYSDHSLLYIEDPSDPPENASRGCYGMWQVKQAFDHAFIRLHSTVLSRDNPVPQRESLLSEIIQVSQEVEEYRNWVNSNWPAALPLSPSTTPTHHYFLPPMLPLLPPTLYIPQTFMTPFHFAPKPQTGSMEMHSHSTSSNNTSST